MYRPWIRCALSQHPSFVAAACGSNDSSRMKGYFSLYFQLVFSLQRGLLIKRAGKFFWLKKNRTRSVTSESFIPRNSLEFQQVCFKEWQAWSGSPPTSRSRVPKHLSICTWPHWFSRFPDIRLLASRPWTWTARGRPNLQNPGHTRQQNTPENYLTRQWKKKQPFEDVFSY